jgi:hypothetical protein
MKDVKRKSMILLEFHLGNDLLKGFLSDLLALFIFTFL